MMGNTIAGFNIQSSDGLTAYYQNFAGNGQIPMEYLALHEVAHRTTAGEIMNLATQDRTDSFISGSSNWADENLPNTVALATLRAMGVNLGQYSAASGPGTVQGGWQPTATWTAGQ